MIRWADVKAMPVRNVAGLMTGTSMDGLDVALCQIAAPDLKVRLIAFETLPLPAELRSALAAERLHDLAALARTHMAIGRYYAEALAAMVQRHGFAPHLVGSHGQTVYHEHGVTTLQLGEPAFMAARLGCPVVHDFRTNDLAVGGCGAPLVPYVDYRLLAGRGEALLAVNIGGIANCTALPAEPERFEAVLGMDCGPGNMVLDQLAERHSDGAQMADIDGRLAARGRVLAPLLAELCADPFFALVPPKSAGREQFGPPFVDALLQRAPLQDEQDWCDLLATASELTAFGIHDTYRRFIAPALPVDAVVISGGGTHNPDLMARIARQFDPIPIRTTDAHGLPVDAKEAMAFAVLASERIDERPSNVPVVTGARAQVLLGKITEC